MIPDPEESRLKLEESISQFWEGECGRVQGNFDEIFEVEYTFLQEKCYPFEVDLNVFKTKNHAYYGMRSAYRELLARIILELAAEGIHFLNVTEAKFNRKTGEDPMAGTDSVVLKIRAWRAVQK